MRTTILFSPIGGNDPVSSATEYDGSMLHICRYYRPDEVYLYLSKEMVERQKRDDRYCYCIKQLGEMLNHNFNIHNIERPELEDVQLYDDYYDDFKKILKNIMEKMSDEDTLLLNVASGTPAMKSALLVLSVLSDNRMKPIQVVTPDRDINIHRGKDLDYDPEYYWAVNRDNEEGAENRCIEALCPNLTSILKKNIIIKQVQSYNYAAAFILAEEMRGELSEEVYRLLELAVARQQLNIAKVVALSNKYGFDVLPVKDSSKIILFEYALTLKIKIARKEYGDFMRAISPLISDLFEEILKVQCHIVVKEYCQKQKGVWKWKNSKLLSDAKGREILEVLKQEFRGDFRDTAVMASNLKPLILYYSSDPKLKQSVEDMRNIEEKVRNLAAHEIVSITDERLGELLEQPITMKQIYSMIKNLVVNAKIKITESDWNSYDSMNQLIVDALNLEIHE